MSWWSDFADDIELDAPLGPMTWFKLGGPARYLFRPRDEHALAALLARAADEGVPVRVLGAGANVLISDEGFNGVVVRLDRPAFRRVDWQGPTVTVGGGADLMPFSRACCRRGLSGVECMAGIPATVGGAARMNAGGRFGEFSDVVRSLDVIDLDGEHETWTRQRAGFGYRQSAVGKRIVTAVQLVLRPDDPARVLRTYEAYQEYKIGTQPMVERSAGCIFKNPPDLSAGKAIDLAGLKGTRYRHARVSERHANFIVVDKQGTASDVMHLIDLVRDRVRAVMNTELEIEVDIWRSTRERVTAR